MHVDWVVVDLEQATSIVFSMATRFRYHFDEGSFATHVALDHLNQKRAPNGDIYFPAACNHLFVYQQATEKVIQLDQINDAANPHPVTDADAKQYAHEFNTDGSKLYTGTQSNRLPAIIEIDTASHATKVLGHVGRNRNTFSYAYYMQPDTITAQKWIYVAVGKNPWELCALNAETGETRLLQSRPATQVIRLVVMPEGVRADLGPGIQDSWWCVDGEIAHKYVSRYDPTRLPFKPRNVTPYSNPLVNPPQLDVTAGMGLVKWRPAGSTGPYTSVAFPIPHGEPVDIESLIALPEGNVLGNVKNYQGFFRYDARTRSTAWFGPWEQGGLSRGPRLLVGDTVWMAGYPNGMLWAYNPEQPWNPAVNPVQHQNFSASQMKYADFMDYSRITGRLYCAGHREREGFGGAIGWYDIGTGAFGGTSENLGSINPAGFVVLDGISRLVFSGRPSADPAVPDPPPDAQLVICDFNLMEIERQTVMPGMVDAGVLFKTAIPQVIIGLSATSKILYRYDVGARSLLARVSLGENVAVGPSWQDHVSGAIHAILGSALSAIDPESLDRTVLCSLPMLTGASRFVFNGKEVMVANGPDLYTLEPGLQHLRAEISGIFSGPVLRVSVQSSAPIVKQSVGVFMLELIGIGHGGKRLLVRASLDSIATVPVSGRFVRSATATEHRFTYATALKIPAGSITAVLMRLTDPNRQRTELNANV